jgi:hypothetical protein
LGGKTILKPKEVLAMETIKEYVPIQRYLKNVYSRYVELQDMISMATNEYLLENVERELRIEQERLAPNKSGLPSITDIMLFMKSAHRKRLDFNLGREQVYTECDLRDAIRTRSSLEQLCSLRKYLPKKNGELDCQSTLYREWEENLKKFMPR